MPQTLYNNANSFCIFVINITFPGTRNRLCSQINNSAGAILDIFFLWKKYTKR
jgi:hypothetical protein